MAGIVTIFKTRGPEGSLNIGSRPLDTLVTFLTLVKTSSPALAEEKNFMSHDVIMLYRATNFLSLVDFSDEILSVIERLLMEAALPEHPFWSVDSNLFQMELVEERRRAGINVEAEHAVFKATCQTSFAEVARLIRVRLGRADEPSS